MTVGHVVAITAFSLGAYIVVYMPGVVTRNNMHYQDNTISSPPSSLDPASLAKEKAIREDEEWAAEKNNAQKVQPPQSELPTKETAAQRRRLLKAQEESAATNASAALTLKPPMTIMGIARVAQNLPQLRNHCGGLSTFPLSYFRRHTSARVPNAALVQRITSYTNKPSTHTSHSQKGDLGYRETARNGGVNGRISSHGRLQRRYFSRVQRRWTW